MARPHGCPRARAHGETPPPGQASGASTVRATQPASAYRLATTVAVKAGEKRYLFPMTLEGPEAPRPRSPSPRSRRGCCSTRSPTSPRRPTATTRSRASPRTSPRPLIVYGTGTAGGGEPHARPALPVGPGRRLLGDACRRSSRTPRWTRPARRARPLRDRRPAGQHAPRPRPAEGPGRDGAGHLPLPGGDLRRRAGRPLPRAAEPLRAGARRCTSSSPTARSSSTR